MKHYFYVYRIGALGPQRKHETKAKARKEAKRLLSKYPADVFVILEAVSEVKNKKS